MLEALDTPIRDSSISTEGMSSPEEGPAWAVGDERSGQFKDDDVFSWPGRREH